MKVLSQALLTEQKKRTRQPAVAVNFTTTARPGAFEHIQWGLFDWTNLYTTTGITPTYHGVAIPQDGSLNRVRVTGGRVYHQRIAAPDEDSDYSAAWTDLGAVNGSPVAISASLLGAEVIIFACKNGASYTNHLWYISSTDNGVNFGSWTEILPADINIICTQFIAASHDTATVIGLVFGNSTDGYLRVLTRATDGTTWTNQGACGDSQFYQSATLYTNHDDLFIIGLRNEGTTFRLIEMILGKSHAMPGYYWSTPFVINTGEATLEITDTPLQSIPAPLAPTEFFSPIVDISTGPPYLYQYPGQEPYYNWLPPHDVWAPQPAVIPAPSIANIDLGNPFLCKPPDQPVLMSFTRLNERWTYRLKPGTNFIDGHWQRSYMQRFNTSYGMALASDATHVWGTTANEVWRTPIPGSLQLPPPPGYGIEIDNIIPPADIISVKETIKYQAVSSLVVELNNYQGSYNSLPYQAIKRGSKVWLSYGYQSSSKLFSTAKSYFLQDWTYHRSPGRVSVIFNCIDGWGLLENLKMPAPAELNYLSDEYSVYDIIEQLITSIGCLLDYKSRSTAMTTLYPRLSIRAGESGAGIIKRLLQLVPDVIFFDGETAYIVYPQESDTHCYIYHFTEES